MASVFSELFNGSDGVALTTANVSIATSVFGTGTSVFSTTVKKEGTASARFTSTAGLRDLELNPTPSSTDTTRYFSFYIYPVSAPSANTILHFLGASSASLATQLVFNADRTVKIQNNAGILIATSTTSTLPLNEWSRIDWSLVGSTVRLEVYPGNANCDAAVATALAADTKTGSTTPPANPLTYQILGIATSTTNDFYLDAVRADNAALPGPISTGQMAAPASDITTAGWTLTGGATAAAVLDEEPFSDADYATSPNSPSSSVLEVKFASLTDPASSTGHVASYRLRSENASSSSVVVGVYQGTTLIASQTHNPVPSTYTAYTLTLLAAEADAVTNYADLRIRFTATAS